MAQGLEEDVKKKNGPKALSAPQLRGYARRLFNAHKTSERSGWKKHIAGVCERVYRLQAHHTLGKMDHSFLNTWYTQAKAALTEDAFRCMGLLEQYGLIELLLFLYLCVKDLLDQGQPEKAAQVLVRTAFVPFSLFISDTFCGLQEPWTPEKIMERIVSEERNC